MSQKSFCVEGHCAECCYGECRLLNAFMLNVMILSVIELSFVMLNVITMSVLAPFTKITHKSMVLTNLLTIVLTSLYENGVRYLKREQNFSSIFV